MKRGKEIYLLGTTNKGKRREMEEILQEEGIEVLPASDSPPLPAVGEGGGTYLENARMKGEGYARSTPLPVITDDSGLEVEGLDNRPGIRSSRFMDARSDSERVQILLRELDGVEGRGRRAIFRCVAACVFQDGRTIHAEGVCPGRIAHSPRGEGGFGYDPIFIPEGHERTMAELSMKEKNRISHRGRAMRALASLLKGRKG